MVASFFTLTLFVGPPPDIDYDSARAQLDAAIDGIGHSNTDDSIAAVEQGLASITAHPLELASDLDALDDLEHARVSLVWLHLAQGDAEAATAAMDSAIRASRGHLRTASSFGPIVRELYEERLAALTKQGTAIIEVECRIPCQVIIDERRSANPSEPLLLGPHRVWVGASDDGSELHLFDVVLESRDVTQLLVHDAPVEHRHVDPVEPPVSSITQDSASNKKRILPRWTEILGLSLGTLAVSSGAVLLALDGKCGNPACNYRWENTVRGAVITGIGGAALLAFGAVLTVDEVRVRGVEAKQVMLTWTLRF